jgi:hypothetical protein
MKKFTEKILITRARDVSTLGSMNRRSRQSNSSEWQTIDNITHTRKRTPMVPTKAPDMLSWEGTPDTTCLSPGNWRIS